MQDADAVDEMGDLAQDVARHEDGDALLAGQRAQQLADLDDAGGVERVGRLVEDEQLGTVQQRPGEGEPLLVAEREHLGAPVGEPAEPQQLDDLGDRRARRPREAALDVEILAHGQVGVGGRGLDEVADAGKGAVRTRLHAHAEHLDVAAGRRMRPSSMRMVVVLPAPFLPRKP